MEEKVLFDELDEKFDDVESIDEIFNNESANERYIVCGYAERWDRHGEAAKGHMRYMFKSVAEAINRTASSFGMCYIKVSEEKYGRLKLDISHHDGHCSLEIREITKRGDEICDREYYEEEAVEKIVSQKNATRNVKWTKKY